MTATDELRRMLDERGVEWGNIRNDGSESDYLTEWQFENNQGKAIAIEWAVGSGLSVEVHRYHLTPEQAIAATLGATDARPTQAESSETCHIDVRNGDWYCDGCGEMVGTCDPDSELCVDGNYVSMWNFCPMCGRRIEQ